MKSADAGRSRPTGLRAEAVAESYLVGKGYAVLARQHHSRDGEVDLIVARDDLIAFVEVKARKPSALVEPLESVSPSKARKIVRAAVHFIQQAGVESRALRFDVVCVELGQGDRARVTQHVEGAFDASVADDQRGAGQ